MPAYRIYRLKESRRSSFRWAPHSSGAAAVKPRDYEAETSVEAATPYAAWSTLQTSEHKLRLGDVLETPEGELRIFKYVGFEEAHWELPEVESGLESIPVAAGA